MIITKHLVWILIVAAFLVRILWLPGNMFFGFEQGRDLLAAAKIAKLEEFRLIGANTDEQGIFHGVLYYYILAPLYLIFQGNPLLIQYFLIWINCLAIYFLYKSVQTLFGKYEAVVASLFYIFSYSTVIYARWLSNPSLIPAATILLLWTLVKARVNSSYLILSTVLWSIIFHLSLASATVLVLPIIFTLLLWKIKVNIRVLILSLMAAFIIFSPYVVFDLRHNFFLSNNVVHYLTTRAAGIDRKGAVDQFTNELVDNYYPQQRNFALGAFGVVLLLSLASLRRKETTVILFFLLLPVLFFFFLGVRPLRHIFIISPIFFSILSSIAVAILARKNKALSFLLLALIIMGNCYSLYLRLPTNKGSFLNHAQRSFLADQENALDFIYQDAVGKPFSYDYFSIPYWRNEAWEYLFSWYGKNKYGYLPSKERTDVFYVVAEPDETKPIYKDNWYGEMNAKYDVIETKQFGDLTAEKRKVKPTS